MNLVAYESAHLRSLRSYLMVTVIRHEKSGLEGIEFIFRSGTTVRRWNMCGNSIPRSSPNHTLMCVLDKSNTREPPQPVNFLHFSPALHVNSRFQEIRSGRQHQRNPSRTRPERRDCVGINTVTLDCGWLAPTCDYQPASQQLTRRTKRS